MPIPIHHYKKPRTIQSTAITKKARKQFGSVGILAQADNNNNNVDINNYQNYSPVNNFTKNNNI